MQNTLQKSCILNNVSKDIQCNFLYQMIIYCTKKYMYEKSFLKNTEFLLRIFQPELHSILLDCIIHIIIYAS